MTRPDNAWHLDVDRPTLDAAYNNAAAVPGSAALMQSFGERSAALRAAHPGYRELVYGPGLRNRIDYFPADRPGPLLIFIHGGYWQMRAKEDFGFVAAGPLAHGVHVALAGYTLAPDSSLTGIVDEIHASIAYLRDEAELPSVDLGRIVVSGWSAGGHLTALCLDPPGVIGGVAISGLYELAPIRRCYVNDKLRLTEAEEAALSPLRLPLSPKPLAIVCGGGELPEMQRQSTAFAEARSGLPGELLVLPGLNHFTILEQLAAPGGAITQQVLRIAGG